MDFLTQPFRPPPRRKSHSGSPPPPDSHHPPEPSSPTRGSTRKDSISSHGSSQASSEASTSHTPIHQDHLSRFSQLRTASPLPASGGVNGLPDEEKVVYPSEMAGDWKAFGRVQGRVVIWEKGTAGVVGEKQLREEEKGVGEWVVEGSLWITKADQILLILDRDHFPPLPIDRSAALSNRSSRPPSRPSSTRGFSSLARRLSRTESGSSTPVLGGRRRSSVGSLGREGTTTPTATATEEDEKSTKSPILGFLKRVVSPFKRDKGSSPARADGGDDASLSLQRTRSIEIGKRRASAHRAEAAAREQAQQTTKEGKQRASFDEEDEELSTVADDEEEEAELQGTAIKFEEPAGRNKGPLPDYKGYPITALLIPSHSHIHSIRFFPAQTSSSSSSSHPTSFFGSSAAVEEPVTTLPPSGPIASASNDDTDDAPPEGTISFDALLAGTGGGAENRKNKNKNKPEVVEYRPPMVEVDVVAPIDDSAVEDEAQDGGEQGNKAREVTVGFVFKEVLLAQEATTFHHRLLALLPPSHPQSHSHSHSPTRGRSPSPPPRHESGGGGGGGRFGSALMRTLSGGLSRERSRDSAPPPSAAKEREKDKGKAKEREVQVQAGEPSLGAPVGRRRSSFFGLVGAGGGSAGVEPTV